MKLSNRQKSSLVLAAMLLAMAGMIPAVISWDKEFQDKEFGAVVQVADCQEKGVREYVYWRKDLRLEKQLCEEIRN